MPVIANTITSLINSDKDEIFDQMMHLPNISDFVHMKDKHGVSLFDVACSTNDGLNFLLLWTAGFKAGEDKRAQEILMKQTNLRHLGIQHVVECPALVSLLENWTSDNNDQKEVAEQKISSLFESEDVKVVFTPVSVVENKEELRRNAKEWNRLHSTKCEGK